MYSLRLDRLITAFAVGVYDIAPPRHRSASTPFGDVKKLSTVYEMEMVQTTQNSVPMVTSRPALYRYSTQAEINRIDYLMSRYALDEDEAGGLT